MPAFAGLVLVAGVLRPAEVHAQPAIRLLDHSVTVTENAGTYTQQVWLPLAPTAVVTVRVVSGNTSAVTVHPKTLTFTVDNYSTRQEVTYTGVDDNILNHPPAHRQTTVTYTASGGNYAGISTQSSVLVHDDEPIPFTVVEGRSYTLRLSLVVTQGCTPVVVRPRSSDLDVLSTAPATLTWTEQNSGAQQPLTATFHDNNDLGDGRVTLHLPVTRSQSGTSHIPCDSGPVFQDIVFTVTDNDTGELTVDAIPACGTTVTDMSVTPSKALVLKPPPSSEVATEYRVISDSAGRWLGSLPIEPGGRSVRTYYGTFARLRAAFAGFSGFEYRLKDHPDVTAQCTWEFDEGVVDPPEPTPTLPAVRLSASPNPVDEGASVTITARLTEALPSDVTIPLTLTPGTAEAGDYGTLSAIAISAGATTGTGTITTAEDADTDDETFTVALGSLPASVRAGSPSSVTVTITDDDGGGTPPPPSLPAVRLSVSPNPVDEGSSVTVTATLSETLPASATIPLTLTAGTAEADDFGTLSAISISAGSAVGTGTITTAEDADTDDETFTVALGALPASVRAGTPGSVTVTITDDDGGGDGGGGGSVDPTDPSPPTVRLSVSPNPVDEGASLTVTATLSDVLPADVTIPLTLTPGTAEAGDYGTLSAIAISAGATTGTGTITTTEDADTDDETFTVALGLLPAAVTEGSPGSVEVNIRDYTQPNRPPAFDAPSYTFSLRENEDGRQHPLPLGSVAAVDPDGDEVTYALVSGDGQRFGVGARNGAVTYTGAGEDYETEPNRYGLTIRARDPHGAEAAVEVSVLVTDVNELPEVSASCEPCVVRPGGEVRLTAVANDPDGDPMTWRWTAPAGRFMEGSLEAEARWQAPAATGRVAIRVQTSDGRGGSASTEMAVEVVNGPPAFEESSYAFELRENEDGSRDPVALGSVVATDPDGDELTYALLSGDGQRFAVGKRDGAVVYTGAGEDYETEPNRYGLSIRARDPYGAEAAVEVMVEVTNANEAPEVSAAIPDHALVEGGAAAEFGLGPYFEDPDGDRLSYTAASSDSSVSSVTVAGLALTLTPVAYGAAIIEVTASDPDGLSAKQAFTVVVDDRAVRVVLVDMLAALARAHLASARMTLGRRVWPDGAERRPRLKVMGITIPLDREMMRQAAGRLLYETTGPGGLAGGTGNTEFMFGWGGGDRGAAPAASRRNWRLWGQGDIQMFEGNAPAFIGAPVSERGYEGDLRSGWVGFDRAIGERWLAGVAISMSNGTGDWHAGAASGRLWTSLTTVYPYLRWYDGTTSVWTMAAGGRGVAQNVRSGGREGESDLTLRLGHLEVRRRIAEWFGLRADGGWARLATGDGEETVDGLHAAVEQQRFGIELDPSSRHIGLALDASVRRDGGAGQTGAGLELAGGLRAGGGPVRIDALGRILVLHSARGYSERGLGVTISVGRPSEEGGLSLAVSSRWGDNATGTGALWETRLYGLRPDEPGASWSFDARVHWMPRSPHTD